MVRRENSIHKRLKLVEVDKEQLTASRKKALRRLEQLRKRGYNYHEAANTLSPSFPLIPPSSLRWLAYSLWKKHGYKTARAQHRTHTVHGKALVACEKKLQRIGYMVYKEQNQISRLMKLLRGKGNPDLLAIRKRCVDEFDQAILFSQVSREPMETFFMPKDDDLLFVEIVEHGKEQGFLMDQLDRYMKLGKMVILLPIDTTKVELWGLQDIRKKN